MHDRLLAQGYVGPVATPCTLEIDDMVKMQWLRSSMELMALMRKLIDQWIVFNVSDMTKGSTDFLGAVHIELSASEIVMVVPWKHQYDEGGQICVYHRDKLDILEIDIVLVQLIELLEAKCISHC